jgi:Putative adhesin
MGTLSPLRKVILAVGGLLTLGVITAATLSMIDWMAQVTYERNTDITPQRQSIVIHTSGDIAVAPSPDDKVHVHTRVRYGLSKPQLFEQSTSDGVILEARCSGWAGFDSCDIHYEVTVPASFEVEVLASVGDVSATGLTGTVKLSTTGGDVEANGLTGPLTLSSTVGDVFGTGLRSDTVQARTSAGDLSLSFAESPRSVDAHSGIGDVDVAVPPDRYRVRTSSGAGDQFVDATLQSPDADLRIDASSSAGDVTVRRALA